MNSASLVGFDVSPVRARLAGAVAPEEVVASLSDWIRLADAPSPRAIYLADQLGNLHLERRFAHEDDVPDRYDVETTAPDPRLLRFTFRDRAFGALLVTDPTPGLEEFLEEDFAPALFRALYLDDALNENQSMREHLFYLDEMGKLLGQLDLDLLLVNVLELTAAHLGADIGSITLQRPEGLITAVDWGFPHEALTALTLANGQNLTDAIAASAVPVLVTDEELESSDEGDYGRIGRMIALPMCTNDAFWGSINLVAPDRVADLGSSALDGVRSGVGLAATAVENALLLEIKLSREREQEQLKLAHHIQAGLLPQEAPELDGIEVAGSSVSAAMIGGDYYDYFDLPDGRIGLVVADVSGKGVPAGLIMTATRALFRATTARLSDPPRILEEVNRLLCAEGFGSRFVTAAFLSVDVATGYCEYATAGHDPPLVWRADRKKIQGEPVPALPLGLRPNASYEDRLIRLDEGDAILVYTDGVSEAMNSEREQFGEERLRAALAAGGHDSAEGLRDRILTAVEAHCANTTRHDDTTLIAVRRTATALRAASPSERAEW